MKPFKLVLFCIIVTFVMVVSWAVGGMIGNAITSSAPPPPPDAAHAGLMFLVVCGFNSILITVLLGATRTYTGLSKRILLVAYVFVIQFLLTQMETYFFASGIGIGYDQTTGILIAGAFSSSVTTMVAMLVYDKFAGPGSTAKPLRISFVDRKRILVLLAFLTFIGYPFLYLTFGYYVAWQSESLRVFYTSSSAIEPFFQQTAKAFSNGIYFFQILRGLIWIIVTVPIVVLIHGNTARQYLIVGILSALLPTSLLFIPNPYMPADVSLTHFVETSTSNFFWGLLMVWAIKKGLYV